MGAGQAAVIAGGYFNCEPFDPVFRKTRNILRASRERQHVLKGGRTLTYVYNPMWRLLGEQDHWEVAKAPGYAPSRPIGSFGKLGSRVLWDQLFVTRDLLTGAPLALVESELKLVAPLASSTDHCA